MSWIRLEAATFHDPKIRGLKPWGGIAWVAILTMSKLHGWDGVCPPLSVTGRALADHLGMPPSARRHLEEAVEGLIDAHLLVATDDALVVFQWRKYQQDPSARERMRIHRERRKAKNEAKIRARDGVTVTTVTSGDVTGRDVTLKSESKTPVVVSAVDVIPRPPAEPPPQTTPAPATTDTSGLQLSPPPATAPAKPCRYCLGSRHYPLETLSACRHCPDGRALLLVKRDGQRADQDQAHRARLAARRAASNPTDAFPPEAKSG